MGSCKRIGLVCLIWVAGCFTLSAAENGNWTPKHDDIARLERTLKMPLHAPLLADYARYYWGTTERGHRIVRGTLVYGNKAGIYLRNTVTIRQAFTDQGCKFVYVVFGPGKKQTAECDHIE
jgi:hypothetical protein